MKHDTAAIHAQTTDIKLDTANILLKIEQLQARLPNRDVQERDDYMLQRYLETMTTYTEEVLSSVDRQGDHDEETADDDLEEPADIEELTDNKESADDEMAALERFLEDSGEPSESTGDTRVVLTPWAVEAGETPKPEKAQPISTRPQQKKKEKYILFSENLVLDIPLPEKELSKIPHGARDEFTHVRYTAVTCEPALFKEKGYSLRTSLFTTPRPTALLLSIHQADENIYLFDVLKRVWDAVDQLYRDAAFRHTNFNDLPWKRVILHLHFSGKPAGHTSGCLDRISARPLYYDDPEQQGNNRGNGTLFFEEKMIVNGNEVLWQMYEVRKEVYLLPVFLI